MKALVGAFNQEKALVGAFSVIVQPVVEPMDRFTALFRTFGFPPKPFGTEAEEKRKEETVETIQKITSRPNSFSFNIQKFLNIKQEEEVVEDEVQEYKVTTSQNEKDRDAEDDGDKVEDQEEEDDKSGVVVDDQEDTEPSYRSLLLNTYPFPPRKDSATEEDGGIWSRKLPRQKVAGDRLLDIPCKVELQTKVREDWTITEDASTLAFSMIVTYSRTFV